ncbi:hypothetical protein U1Q18_047041 [Sarracenia purpurea var. burkii]
MTVFSKYLGKYLDLKDASFIITIFIQVDDREKLKQVYDDQHEHSFNKACKRQRRPFRYALRAWAKKCDVQDPQLKEMLTVLVDPSSASKRQPPPPPPEPAPEFVLPEDVGSGGGRFYYSDE